MTKFIENQKDLEACISHLEKTTAFAIDLEFDKNHFRYGFNLCLMQLFAEDTCYLIDPLASDVNIATIFPLLEDKRIQKVTFSFGEDMRLLHSLGCFPKNIFDIAVAVRIIGHPPSSLAKVLYEIQDIEINKSAQASDWYSRPLSPKQLEYAASDVLHLLKTQEYVTEKAIELGREKWIKEENLVWDQVDYSTIDNNVYLKDKDKNRLTKYEWFIFSKLMAVREEKACLLDRPSYKVIDKDYLLEMAQRPTQINRFDKIRRMHPKLKNTAFKEELRTVLNKAIDQANSLQLSKEETAANRLSPEEYALYKERKKLRDHAKKTVFKPIQECITRDLGENITTLILNNRLIDDLAIGIKNNILPYKQAIIEQYGQELGLNLRQYYSL